MIKKSLVMIGLFSVLLGACTPTKTPTVEIKTQETEEVQPSVVEEKVEEVVPEVEVKEEKSDVLTPNTIITILEDSFEGVGDVSYDSESNIFYFTPTDPNFALDVGYAILHSDPSDWNEMVNSFAELSGEVSKFLNDDGVLLAVVNPENTENILLVTVNGVVMYDAVNEALGN